MSNRDFPPEEVDATIKSIDLYLERLAQSNLQHTQLNAFNEWSKNTPVEYKTLYSAFMAGCAVARPQESGRKGADATSAVGDGSTHKAPSDDR